MAPKTPSLTQSVNELRERVGLLKSTVYTFLAKNQAMDDGNRSKRHITSTDLERPGEFERRLQSLEKRLKKKSVKPVKRTEYKRISEELYELILSMPKNVKTIENYKSIIAVFWAVGNTKHIVNDIVVRFGLWHEIGHIYYQTNFLEAAVEMRTIWLQNFVNLVQGSDDPGLFFTN